MEKFRLVFSRHKLVFSRRLPLPTSEKSGVTHPYKSIQVFTNLYTNLSYKSLQCKKRKKREREKLFKTYFENFCK